MARAALHDDPRRCSPEPPRVVARLDDDPVACCQSVECAPEPGVDDRPIVNPTLTVLVRTRVGVSPDGDPVFDWAEAGEGLAVLWDQRQEVDDIAGVERMVARGALLWEGGDVPTSALIRSSHGGTWRVTSSARRVDLLSFEAVRIIDTDEGDSAAEVE